MWSGLGGLTHHRGFLWVRPVDAVALGELADGVTEQRFKGLVGVGGVLWRDAQGEDIWKTFSRDLLRPPNTQALWYQRRCNHVQTDAAVLYVQQVPYNWLKKNKWKNVSPLQRRHLTSNHFRLMSPD